MGQESLCVRNCTIDPADWQHLDDSFFEHPENSPERCHVRWSLPCKAKYDNFSVGLSLKDLFHILEMLRFSTWSRGEDFNLKLRLLPRIDNFRVCVFCVVGEIRHIDVHIQSTCPRGVSGNVTKDPESRWNAEATKRSDGSSEATLKAWCWSLFEASSSDSELWVKNNFRNKIAHLVIRIQ